MEYVVHTVETCDVYHSDKDELQTVLTKTYYNVIKYSSETLRISTLALPAISGGIFHVKLESVIKALYTALKQYTDEYKTITLMNIKRRHTLPYPRVSIW